MNEFMITMLLMMGPEKFRLSSDKTKLYTLETVSGREKLKVIEGAFADCTDENLLQIIAIHAQ
jgi:hypothetical protein